MVVVEWCFHSGGDGGDCDVFIAAVMCVDGTDGGDSGDFGVVMETMVLQLFRI